MKLFDRSLLGSAALVFMMAFSAANADGKSEFEAILEEHGGGIASTNGVYIAGQGYCGLDWKSGLEAYKLRLEMTVLSAQSVWDRMGRALNSSLKAMKETKMTCDDDLKNMLARKTF